MYRTDGLFSCYVSDPYDRGGISLLSTVYWSSNISSTVPMKLMFQTKASGPFLAAYAYSNANLPYWVINKANFYVVNSLNTRPVKFLLLNDRCYTAA